jgi:23S rRNA (uridine2552-2'-O)-methyltransferase
MYERKDALHQRAKREGYRSRAAYKLLELQRRARLLRRGDVVLDLGAWPGGWLQVASDLVGPTGRVIGVDVAVIDPLPLANVALLRDDVTDAGFAERIAAATDGEVDVLLSDLAPKLTGIAPRDAARSEALADATRAIATRVLRKGGTMVTKTLGGREGEAARAALRPLFAEVRQVGLEATRKGSSELYLIASGFKR